MIQEQFQKWIPIDNLGSAYDVENIIKRYKRYKRKNWIGIRVFCPWGNVRFLFGQMPFIKISC